MENIKKLYLIVLRCLKESIKKIQIFGQNHGFPRLENLQFSRCIKCTFFESREDCFLPETLPNFI